MTGRDSSERAHVMNTTTNANDAYRAAREKLDERLNRMNHAIREHVERQYKDRANWGFAGDMNHVNEILGEAIEFLGGAKEKTK